MILKTNTKSLIPAFPGSVNGAIIYLITSPRDKGVLLGASLSFTPHSTHI